MTALTSQLELLTLTVNDMQFDALAAGPVDGELVLCLHGFPEFADAWSKVLPLLAAAGYRAVAVDQRGYSPGARPAQVADYSLRLLVSDVLGFANQLGASQFHLVGHDWGGIVAWALGSWYPERLMSLTVVSTPHPDAVWKALKRSFDQQRRSWYVALFRLPAPIPEQLLLAFDARAIRGAYKRRIPREQVERNVRRMREPGVLTAALNWYRALEIGTRIGDVTVPTVFVWGSKDQALGRRAAEETGQYVKAPYRFVPLEGASHWLLAEQPEAIVEAVITWSVRR